MFFPNNYSFAQYIQKIKRISVETDDQCYWNSIVNKLFLVMFLFCISSLKLLVKIWFLAATRYLHYDRTKCLKKSASLIAQLVKKPPAIRRPRFNSWVRKIPWRRDMLATPVFWPGEFHRLYNPWGHKKSDTTEQLSLSRTKSYGSSSLDNI